MDWQTVVLIFDGFLTLIILAIGVGMTFRTNRLEWEVERIKENLDHLVVPFPLPPDQIVREGEEHPEVSDDTPAFLRRQAD